MPRCARVKSFDSVTEDIIDSVSAYIKKDKLNIHIKYIRDAADMKSLSAFLMRELCDMKQKDICKEIGNVTQPHAARSYA